MQSNGPQAKEVHVRRIPESLLWSVWLKDGVWISICDYASKSIVVQGHHGVSVTVSLESVTNYKAVRRRRLGIWKYIPPAMGCRVTARVDHDKKISHLESMTKTTTMSGRPITWIHKDGSLMSGRIHSQSSLDQYNCGHFRCQLLISCFWTCRCVRSPASVIYETTFR